jgi:hypothetical protein
VLTNLRWAFIFLVQLGCSGTVVFAKTQALRTVSACSPPRHEFLISA